MQDLGTLGATNSSGLAIHDKGQVVGSADAADGSQHAFVYDAAHGMRDLNLLIAPSSGWVLNSAEALNNEGQIVGFGTIGGFQHAFLLTPIPEPSSVVLAGLGLGGLIAWGCRRKRA